MVVAMDDDSPLRVHDTDEPWIITTDGVTVWVNGPHGMLGRFGRRGIDVHSPDNTYCVACTTGPTDLAAWGQFTRTMYDVHGVMVDTSYTPSWLFFQSPNDAIAEMNKRREEEQAASLKFIEIAERVEHAHATWTEVLQRRAARAQGEYETEITSDGLTVADRITALEEWRLRSDKRMSSIAETLTQLELEDGELTEFEQRVITLEWRLNEHSNHWDLQVLANERLRAELADLRRGTEDPG